MTLRNYDYWSDEDIHTLVQMRQEGYKHREIAEVIGRDVGAVVAKYSRLGLPKELKITYKQRHNHTETLNCLRCQRPFESVDRRLNRMCPDCRSQNLPANDCIIHL